MTEKPPERSPDLARTIFQVLALGALITTSFWIMRPFLIALVWAATVVIATWPLLLRAQAWLGGRRAFAVALMTTVLLLILVVPLYFAVTTIVANVTNITGWSKSLASLTLSGPPAWVQAIPLVGARAAASWRQLADSTPQEITTYVVPLRSHGRILVSGPGG
jgi:predicted PurR-regulated permease PerM